MSCLRSGIRSGVKSTGRAAAAVIVLPADAAPATRKKKKRKRNSNPKGKCGDPVRSDELLQESGREKNVRRTIVRDDANILQCRGKDERKFF